MATRPSQPEIQRRDQFAGRPQFTEHDGVAVYGTSSDPNLRHRAIGGNFTRRFMNPIYLALPALLAMSLSAWAGPSANSAYIHDVEGLLNSVESRDPSRPQLTLKLADALFNEALAL